MTNQITYALDEANKLLPWLRKRLEEIALAHRDLERFQKGVKVAQKRSQSNGHRDIGNEISAIEMQVVAQMKRIKQLIDSLSERQIEIRDVNSGLVDFPSIRQGQKIWLCWCKDEQEIAFWHPWDTGFTNRQPL